MATRDIIVVGASAGGVEALKELVAMLPSDLDATVFVVLHIPPDFPSLLASVLKTAGKLPVVSAEDNRTRFPRESNARLSSL